MGEFVGDDPFSLGSVAAYVEVEFDGVFGIRVLLRRIRVLELEGFELLVEFV